MKTNGIKRTFVVSFDHTQGDIPVLLVGETKRGSNVMEVIAAYKDQEAVDIYKKLIQVKDDERKL